MQSCNKNLREKKPRFFFQGIRADSLREAIESCPADRRPRFMYLNPTGANPTGKVITEARKRDVYAVCSEHDVLILEDDPYFYMQFDGRQEPRWGGGGICQC